MKGRVLIILAALALAALPLAAQSQRTLSLPSGPKVVVNVPMGYSFETQFDAAGDALVRMENPIWRIEVTVFVIRETNPEITGGEWQRNFLISRLADALPQAKESDYNFKPLNPGPGCTGVYCQFTDAELKKGDVLPPGEYVHMTGGVKAWQGAFVFFQIMSNDLTSAEYREILQVFRESFQSS